MRGAGLRREEKERGQGQDEDERRPRHDPGRHATVARAAGGGIEPAEPAALHARTEQGEQHRKEGGRQENRYRDHHEPAHRSRAQLVQRHEQQCQEADRDGIPERITVRPAWVAAQRAASAGPSPAAHASR